MKEREFNLKAKAHVEKYIEIKYPQASPSDYILDMTYLCDNMRVREANNPHNINLKLYLGKEFNLDKELIYSCQADTSELLFKKLEEELPLTE